MNKPSCFWFKTRLLNVTNLMSESLYKDMLKLLPDISPINIEDNGRGYVDKLIPKLNNSNSLIVPALLYSLNYQTKEYDYMSEAFQTIFGENVSMIKKSGLKYIMNRLHPKDSKVLTYQLLPDLLSFFGKLSEHQKYQARVQYNFRLKNSTNDYSHFLQQTIIAALDNNGNPWIDVGMLSEISDWKKNNDIICNLYLINNNKSIEKVYSKTYVSTPEKPIILTKREVQIIKLLKAGHSTREIAQILNISEHTIYTHKRNAMSKLDIHSSNDLVRYAYENNL